MNAKREAIPVMKASAIWYARQGFKVFPLHGIVNGKCTCGKDNCKSPGKHPLFADWKDLASSDVATIDQWWTDTPKANIGFPTGAVNGVSVLDFDVKKGGDVAYDDFCEQFPEFKATWLVQTGGGGWHVFFKDCGIGNSVEAIAKGVDTRGNGGYVVAAPSLHYSGRRYEWEDSSRPDNESLAVMPAAIAKRVPEHKWQGSKGEATRVEPFPEVKREDLCAALEFVSSENRDVWVQVGMAIHNESACAESFAIWDAWSQKSDKYDAEDCARVWASFRQSDTGVKLGTVFSMAKACGYKRLRSVESVTTAEPERDSSWRGELLTDKGKVLNRLHNYALILEFGDEFVGRITYDEFGNNVLFNGAALQDEHISYLRTRLEQVFPAAVKSTDVYDAIHLVARRHGFNPVKMYLEGLEWDGVQRVEHFFSDFCGVPYDAYHKGASIAHFVSAIKRIYEPGCQVDLMVVLESSQGMGKTTLWDVLYRPWYREITEDINGKDFFIAIQGIWCADFGEMHQIKRAEVERYKQIITSKSDSFRPPYGKCVVSRPRSCIFVGGTNQDEWLTDSTGGRRFLPIKVAQNIDTAMVASIRDQLFAEAMLLARNPGQWWAIPGAEAHQMERLEHDGWQEVISDWLKFNAFAEKGVKSAVILEKALGIEIGRQSRADQKRCANCMRLLGWRVGTVRPHVGDVFWGYINPNL